MVFKRRDKPPLLSRIREAVYPRRGWRRGIEYLGHRVRRLPDTPHRIALGFSCGVFVSFTPFFGHPHPGGRVALAWLIRGNVMAGLIGTFAGNPLTLPLIAPIALGLGRKILGYGVTGRDPSRIQDAFSQFFVGLWESIQSLFGHGESQWHKLLLFVQDVLWPYFVGGLLPGLIAAIASYYVTRPLVAAYQARRRGPDAGARPRAAGAAGGRRPITPGTPEPGARDHDAETPPGRLRLGVNIDHVATVRNARGGPYPDPMRAARLAEAAGADGITAHLREDRRHITDADIDGADGAR